MSTRALYTFKDQRGEYHVYKHYDGYPETEVGGFAAIAAGAAHAWKLPRFEADEYAAAFIAANKAGPGNIRLTTGKTWRQAASPDIEYRYEIAAGGGQDAFGQPGTITVVCYQVSAGDWDNLKWTQREIFRRSLAEVVAGWYPEMPAAAE